MKSVTSIARVPLIAFLATASVLACGPFIYDLLPIDTVRPGNLRGYVYRGELGVVRPHFARRYLVQAYRRMTGREPLRAVGQLKLFDPALGESHKQWIEAHKRIAGTDPGIQIDRNIGDYQFVRNCLGGAFATAVETLTERSARYGADSPRVREWLKAQDQVFHNCSDEQVVLPDPLPASADPLARADRTYQIASAYFYAIEYGEAAKRFRQIAADQASPWRPYGRYLAGRALLRDATAGTDLDRAQLAEAAAEFRRVLADGSAAFLHASARGLLDRIALRLAPVDRLRVLSASLSSANDVGAQALRDYEYLMDAAVGDTASYEYGDIRDRGTLAATAEMNDWILVMQGVGTGSTDRALAQWKRTGALPWLAASLWKVAVQSADVPALLQAAERVDRASPAFYTVAFLRVRLLALRSRNEDARAVLAALPSQPSATNGPDEETLNFINALRFKLARSMEELLAAAPRSVTAPNESHWSDVEDKPSTQAPRGPVFDDDAGAVFTNRLPLARLVEAAGSTVLPDRLRLRVASAAFTRAWMLKRDDEALAVAPIVASLSSSLAVDMKAFETAVAPQDRHLAGLRLLLRTPGLRANVKGLEDDEDYAHKDLSRSFDHTFRRNWWCGFDEGEKDKSYDGSQVLEWLYEKGSVPYPGFLSKEEIAATERERAALVSLGSAPTYLAAEAVKWANARPADLDAAEALSHAVEGTRWGCTDALSTTASRNAFQTLHRLFPKSEWARKTKYWY